MTTTEPTTATRQFAGVDIPEPGTFAIDVSHSAAAFAVRHLMVSKTRGRFTDFAGQISIGENPLDSSVDVAIQAASITTGDDKRDEHLRSPDFFDVDRYPTLTYKSTGVRHSSGETFFVDGDLTIGEVTRPVTLEVEFEGSVVDPWGGQRVGFAAKTKINREDFGLSWNVALETGGFLVGKDINIDLEVEAVRQ